MYGHKEKRSGGLERLRELMLSPVKAVADGMDIEVLSDREISVDGCTGIAEFSDERIVLESRGLTVVAEGESFEIYTFADGRIKASGRIARIEMIRGNVDA